MSRNQRNDLDQARDDLMSHIHRCGVMKATPEQQTEWMEDTVEYLGELYASLTDEQLVELKAIGKRFCQPVISYGDASPAVQDEDSEKGELAGV